MPLHLALHLAPHLTAPSAVHNLQKAARKPHGSAIWGGAHCAPWLRAGCVSSCATRPLQNQAWHLAPRKCGMRAGECSGQPGRAKQREPGRHRAGTLIERIVGANSSEQVARRGLAAGDWQRWWAAPLPQAAPPGVPDLLQACTAGTYGARMASPRCPRPPLPAGRCTAAGAASVRCRIVPCAAR